MSQKISQLNPITQGPYVKGFVVGILIMMILVTVLTGWRFFIKHDYYITKNPTVIER
mgnify:CR=1